MKDYLFVINRGLSDFNSRNLKINKDVIYFEDKNLANDFFTVFNKKDIVAYRYGINWLSFRITFGREYLIEIRTKTDKRLKINFKSYFGFKKSDYHKKFNDILDALWECYFSDMINDYIQKHENNVSFNIGDISFNDLGLIVASKGFFKTKQVEIPWDKIRTRNYRTYFVIYHFDNPSDLNFVFNYLKDWNVSVLYSVLRTILRDKNIETYK